MGSKGPDMLYEMIEGCVQLFEVARGVRDIAGKTVQDLGRPVRIQTLYICSYVAVPYETRVAFNGDLGA